MVVTMALTNDFFFLESMFYSNPILAMNKPINFKFHSSIMVKFSRYIWNNRPGMSIVCVIFALLHFQGLSPVRRANFWAECCYGWYCYQRHIQDELMWLTTNKNIQKKIQITSWVKQLQSFWAKLESHRYIWGLLNTWVGVTVLRVRIISCKCIREFIVNICVGTAELAFDSGLKKHSLVGHDYLVVSLRLWHPRLPWPWGSRGWALGSPNRYQRPGVSLGWRQVRRQDQLQS